MNEPAKESKEKNDHTSIEWGYGTDIAGDLRFNTEQAIGDILTTIEAATPEGQQLNALKKLIKQRLYILIETNQGSVYHDLNVS